MNSISGKEVLSAVLVRDQSAAFALLNTYAGLRNDEHGTGTSRRFLEMIDELTQCKTDADDHVQKCIKWKAFRPDTDEMIVCEALPFVSVCNHHVLPFIGQAHVAYVPNKTMAGLSKIGRVVQHFARRLQTQERLTGQITSWLEGALEPRGIGVVVRADHMCMTIRGVKTPGSYTTTSAMRGVFADHDRTAKAEFLSFVNGNGRH
jgi:GTP cyclohydrolase I